jgi:hypothetical protein
VKLERDDDNGETKGRKATMTGQRPKVEAKAQRVMGLSHKERRKGEKLSDEKRETRNVSL